MDYRVVLISGETVELRDSELVKDDEEVLVFSCGRAEYRFNWSLVLYYVARARP